MKVKLASYILLAGCFTGFAQNQVRLLSPENDATIYQPHPHLRWQKEAGADIEDRYRVQISRDEAFHTLLVDDSLDVVSRLVCAKPLSTGKYFWRVRREDQTRRNKSSILYVL